MNSSNPNCAFHKKAKSCEYRRKKIGEEHICDHPEWDKGRRDFCENLSDCYCIPSPYKGGCLAKDLAGNCLLTRKSSCVLY